MQNRELRTEVLRSRWSNLEVVTPVVWFGAILLFQVLYDDFSGDRKHLCGRK